MSLRLGLGLEHYFGLGLGLGLGEKVLQLKSNLVHFSLKI